ncbi:MAG TPA: hypothetical protein VE640_05075 [Candidatus Bathyarchaeia archaeon]|nr:hypothetical protein [Candidatus Bathyarchaeia archaeon]
MFYYEQQRGITSNASAGTEDKVLQVRTAANQPTMSIFGLYVSGRHNSPGGLIIRSKRAGTIGSGGSAITPQKRDPDAPAASATVVDATFTAGTTLVAGQIVGCAAQGGFGGWFAATPEQAIRLKPNGGANGNWELYNIAAIASVPFEQITEFAEL